MGFTDRVLKELRWATGEEREAVRAELEGHIEDHAAALEGCGWPRDEAARSAEEAMGDPEALGRALNGRYPLRWLIFFRATAALAVLVCAVFLLSAAPFLRLYHAWGNLTARFAPERGAFAQKARPEETWSRELDLRVELGSDVLRVYRAAVDEARGEASLYVCNYDQRIFGAASGLLLDSVEVTGPTGEEGRSGGGGGNAGAYFWVFREIPLEAGGGRLTLTYDRFGERAALEIPIEWEGGA